MPRPQHQSLQRNGGNEELTRCCASCRLAGCLRPGTAPYRCPPRICYDTYLGSDFAQECEQQGESIGCPRTSDNSQCAPYDDICLNRRSLEKAATAQDTERKRQVAAAAAAQADEIRNKQAQVEEAARYARPVGAPDWYILSDRTKACFRAYDMAKANGAPALRSPDAWQTFERDAGVFLNLRTTRDANRQVAMAEVVSMRIPESVISSQQSNTARSSALSGSPTAPSPTRKS